MRSAVSSILSDMSEPSPLSYPDYNQVFLDHRRFLVLVKSVSPATLKPKAFARVFEVLDRCHAKVAVKSADDLTRHIEVRFVRNYPVENNDWGDFQHHRAVLGLVSVGAYKTVQEQAELGRLHDMLKSKYSKTILCSRLIALKDDNDAENSKNDLCPDENKSPFKNNKNHLENQLSSSPVPPMSPRLSSTNSPHGKLDYGQQNMNEKALENDISTFLTTMFWLLEKTRVEKLALDSSGKVPLLCAPFEKRDFVGLDLESRVNRKRTAGRFKKHIGDISLMCGMFKEAFDLYEQAVEILRSCNDWLWLANGLEGLSAISAVVHYPSASRSNSLKRNTSFQNKSPNAINNKNKKEKNSFDVDEAFRKRVLSPKNLIEMLREAVIHYSKYRHAGVMETEVSIKAVQVLIEQGDILFAAEFLQNIVFINLQMADEEKVARFNALSKLYTRLNFRRKAAFFHRVAAMRCVAPQNPHTDWNQCYQLMLKTLPGYDINFQHVSFNSSLPRGWPFIQFKILQELVGTARRMGDHVSATRHMVFIIQNLFNFMADQERAEMCQRLTILTSKSPGTPVPHTIDGGLILPPVNIYTIPKVIEFKPCPLVEPLVLPSGKRSGSSDGPFIWTPIISESGRKKKNLNWVQNEISSVNITVINPLATKLSISNFSLITEGVQFDAFPSSFILEPRAGPIQLKLSGTPLESGMLNILGYSCIVFGVRSNCRLKSLNISELKEDFILIDVCPSIPRLELTVMKQLEPLVPGDPLKMKLYHGEKSKFQLSLLNASNLKVECLNVDLRTTPLKYKKFSTVTGLETQEVCPGHSVEFFVELESPRTLCKFCEVNEVIEEEQGETFNKENSESFSVSVIIKYSSNPESSRGYCRQLVQKCEVTFLPSLVVTWWDILPGENSNECYVVLDLQNLTEHEAELRYSDGKRIVIDGLGTCRIPLPVEKIQCPNSKNDEEVVEKQKFLANYLDEKVDLTWEFLSEKRSGLISLADIKFNNDMISRLEKSSVSWSVSLNGQKWLGMDYTLESGVPLTFQLSMVNEYNVPVQCQFECKGNYIIEGSSDVPSSQKKINVSGSKILRDCDPGDILNHTAFLIPCSPGRISLKCFCDVFEKGADEKIDQIQIPCIFINIV